MLDFFEANKILLFIVFFIPGFISMKVYNLMIASEKVNFSESLGEAIAFSSINYAALSWLIIIIYKSNLYTNHISCFIVSVIFIIFFAPILWTILFVKLTKSTFFKKHFLGLKKDPWDYYFEKKKSSCWVIVNLKNGERIGGVYSGKSYTSEYPRKAQIYLEELWEIEGKKHFIKKIEGTDGILIFGDEIKSLEFYK